MMSLKGLKFFPAMKKTEIPLIGKKERQATFGEPKFQKWQEDDVIGCYTMLISVQL